MIDLTVEGANQFADLAKRLKAQGESGKGLRKELYAAIFRATRDVKQDIRESFRDRLPQRGGLSRTPLKVVTRARMGGPKVGIRISTISGAGYQLGFINAGKVKHPVFGHAPMAPQAVSEGSLTDPQEAKAPDVREQIVRAINDIARRVEG